LLQHADNPVDWWEWGDEAFTEAKRRDVPVLLSVGYSACHWCHVMAHESFEDAGTAAVMNEHLVSIKVDREERPDVDAVYMTATQALTGQGGWPMTVFLTHDREPFYCGTYYPRQQFTQLVLAIARAWRENRDAIAGQAREVTAALAETVAADVADGGDESTITPQTGDSAVAALARSFDQSRGGFGGAPKFPPSSVLEFLLRYSERAPNAGEALSMAARTLEAMARGGIYDQLGGGFARYSVDPSWVVPHFEKMLYDNAQLARVYAHWWRRADSALGRRVAEQTCDWMIADLRTAEGGFASALDADSEGGEGAFYVWTVDQLAGALGQEDATFAREIFAVSAGGNFEHGSSVLRLPAEPADPADLELFGQVRAALLRARAARPAPPRDDKVVAAWNGLAITALADCGLLFGRDDYVGAALTAAELLARVHLTSGRLARTSKDGVAGPSAGVLDDYGCVAAAFLTLSGVTGEGRWVALAAQLLDVALERFRGADGRWYDTADDSERLIYRPADPTDGPTPSGTFAVAGALLSYAALTGSPRHRDAAIQALGPLGRIAGRYPLAAGWGLAVAEAMLSGPAEIAVVGPRGDEGTVALHRAAAFGAPPGAVIALGSPPGAAAAGLPADSVEPADGPEPADGSEPADGHEPPVPLLAGRGLVDGRPAAYVCRDFSCRLPVTTPRELLVQLRS
jgi:uncharacterized protein YyaL (SSP411 family)